MPNDHNETVSLQCSLSDFSKNTTPFTEVKNYLLGSNASLNDEMEFQEVSSSAPSTVTINSKTPQKIKFLNLIFQSPRRGNTIF